MEAEEFFRPHATAHADYRERSVARPELVSHCKNLGPRLERQHIPPFVALPLRIPDSGACVSRDVAAGECPGERLPEGAEDVVP
jgi:hypothetical protein